MVLQNDLRYVTDKYFAISELFQIELPEFYNKNTFWGRWLRSKNFISKIGSTLFVHGGIHPELIAKYKSITDINTIMRKNIDTNRDTIKSDQELSDLFRSKGPVWHRGFFEPDSLPDVSEDDLKNILEHLLKGAMMKIDKEFYKSKTMWAALLTALIPAIFPQAKEVIVEHPEYVMGAIAFIFSVLRIKTNSAVVVKKAKSLV